MNRAEPTPESLKGRKKIVVLKRDANGKLMKAHPFILKGKKKILKQQALAAREDKLAHTAQMVAKGDYRDKERPFAKKDIWAKYLCPTGHCSVCGRYYLLKKSLQNHMQVSDIRIVRLMPWILDVCIITLQLVHFFSWFQCPVCLLWKTRVKDLTDHIEEKHPDKEGLLLNCIDCGQHFSSSTLLAHVQSCLRGKVMSSEERDHRLSR